MPSVDKRMLRTIELVYEAALDERLWTGALKALTEFTDSQAATFWVLDGSDQPRLPTFTYLNIDRPFIDDYLANMVPLDPTVQYLVSHPKQPIVHDGLVISEREKDHHPYYAWHHRYSDLRFRLVSQIAPAPAVQAGIALHRVRKLGRYEPQDIEQFALLHNHIERALAIAFRLGSLGTLQQCTADMLDRNPAAVVLLDARRRVVYCNRRAERFRLNGDGISLSTHGVSLARKPDNDHLQKLIGQALAINAGQTVRAEGAMRIPRPSRKRAFFVLVAPVSKQYSGLSSLRPTVCVVIADPEEPRIFDHRRLMATFDLTDAEARLAAHLAAGDDLRSCAAKLSISYGTARMRLAEIFCKTDTHRQGELVKLLLTALTIV